MPRRRNEPGPDFEPAADDAMGRFLRLPPGAQAAVVVLLLAAAALVAWVYFRGRVPATGPGTGSSQANVSPQMLLGNPSNAALDPNNYLRVGPYFILSYNSGAGEPNWVSWRLVASDLGNAPRKLEFDADILPPGFVQIVHRDYNRSGFDRGHMCPHSDRAHDQTSSFATFVMTNVIPQAPNVNRKAWAQMEDYCRSLVRSHHRLYITSGPAGRGGVGSNPGRVDTIAGGRVVVPASCWKIAVILPDDGTDPDPATIPATTRVLAVDMPNDNTVVGETWAQYRTSPAEIERETGLHFFDRLRPEVAAALRAKVDTDPLPAPRVMGHGKDSDQYRSTESGGIMQ
jgi:endonuclease G